MEIVERQALYSPEVAVLPVDTVVPEEFRQIAQNSQAQRSSQLCLKHLQHVSNLFPVTG